MVQNEVNVERERERMSAGEDEELKTMDRVPSACGVGLLAKVKVQIARAAHAPGRMEDPRLAPLQRSLAAGEGGEGGHGSSSSSSSKKKKKKKKKVAGAPLMEGKGTFTK
jgi:hypothetical protein